MGILLGFVGFIVKVLWGVMKFTGAWVTVLIVVVVTSLESKYYPNGHQVADWVSTMCTIGACLPILYITPRNLVRAITKDESFSFIGLLTRRREKKQKEAVKPKVNKEIKEAAPKGVIFGKEGSRFVTKPEDKDGHILVIGGAGSGKSSCIAIPSLMSWQNRIFAIDIKGELLEKTKHKRGLVKVFNPSNDEAYGYDPFYMLHKSNNLGQDMKEIVMAIIPLSPNVKDPFWISAAQNYLTGALIYFYKQDMKFIEAITEIQKTPPTQLVEEIQEGCYDLAKLYTNQFVGLDTKTLSGIFTEVSNKIMLFATDEQLKKALSKDKVITPDSIEKGSDIYICIEESKLEQWNCLLTLIVNQFLKHFERRADMDATPVLFLLDEFARLGKIEAVTNGLATLRSKKITIAILTQSLAQLDAIYGKEYRQIIADNCQYKAILNATDADTQEYFSKLVGTYDKEKTSYNANFEQYTGLGKGTGRSITTEEKKIIKPEEFATLKDVVLLTPFGFFRVDKAPYYSTKAFQ